jgi:molybdate/tungstate transport system substrate-binding protein
MRKAYKVFVVIAAIILLLSTYFFVTNYVYVNPSKQTLTVMVATSLEYPMAKVQADFEKLHPNVDVEIQGHGSIQAIRQVTELGMKADVLMVADYSLIPTMMYSTKMPNSDESYADFYVCFATNSLVLAYTNQSRYASEINSENWYSILSQPDVKIGMANPELDSLGYRTLAAIQLAQDYYNSSDLFHNLITSNFNPPIDSVPDGSNYTIVIPIVQQPVGDKITLTASEVDIIALLQTGNLDYGFIYLSNAKQYGLNYVELPNEINLGSSQYQDNYERVYFAFDHQRFETVNLDRSAQTIYYGLTIPNNAPNPQLAAEFVQFILTGGGATDFASSYQPVFSPSYTDNLHALPENLQLQVQQEP